MNKYDSYVNKANRYEIFGFRKKAIKIMELAIEEPFTKLEIGSGLIYIGLMYRKLKDLDKANKNFENALDLCKDEQYPYSSNFKTIIQSFSENRETEKAMKWIHHLTERAIYDKNFSKLKKLKLE
ncbi:hypothetical protein H9650_04875 [Psychrobacillus sp. Sa2BUA9]|uniref:Tetratricopeptide repeat protein n=1 Tax=Psychrobacillus faecigallinarum TaxID=2762235 RepID=A0ABR8R6M9_9BACI|nr:hypothetical protein [Psychrobacillus faecigallinarum]MBD7943444.1 hypothetical protein [Psychrobacillus faecigallinarum]